MPYLPMLKSRLFQAKQYPLTIYNGDAIIDKAFRFYTRDCDGNDENFDFPDYVSSYLRVYNERNGRLLLTLALTRSGTYLIANASDTEMTFEDSGNYWYEVGYVRSGGYEQALRYGTAQVI